MVSDPRVWEIKENRRRKKKRLMSATALLEKKNQFRDNLNLRVPTFHNGVWWTYPGFTCAEMVPTVVSEGFPGVSVL